MLRNSALAVCCALLLPGGGAHAQAGLAKVDMGTLQSAYECYDFNKMKSKPCKSLFKTISSQTRTEAQAGVAKDTGLNGN